MINFLLNFKSFFYATISASLVLLATYLKGQKDNKEKQNLKDLENDQKYFKRVIKAKNDSLNISVNDKLEWMRKRFDRNKKR
jgi:hypothetical protein